MDPASGEALFASRVLLVEGKPYWDSKFLARTLASDPSIELVSIVLIVIQLRWLQEFLEEDKSRTIESGKTLRVSIFTKNSHP